MKCQTCGTTLVSLSKTSALDCPNKHCPDKQHFPPLDLPKMKTPNNPPAFPLELTPAVEDALSFLTCNTAPLARCYRDAGLAPNLPRKIEKEQAFILHKFVLLALEHGDSWKEEFSKQIAPVIEKAEAMLAEREKDSK